MVDGYVTEIPYTMGYYSHLSPAFQELILAFNGIQSPNWREPFNYCELGCGYGFTSIILALIYPQGEFYATDINPDHVVFAESLVKELGLRNIHFSDASFKDYLGDALPFFDYISLHGVYSWVGPEVRETIRKFIAEKLKIGGLLSISYNAFPGFNATVPIRHFLHRYHELASTGSFSQSIKDAITFLQKMQENNGLLFSNPNYVGVLNQISAQGNYRYVVHEYLHDYWQPFYSDQIFEEMEAIKLTYAGSATILENIPSFCFSAEAYNHIQNLSNLKMKELVKDLYLNTSFRKDIYVKGNLPLSPKRKQEYFSNLSVVSTVNKSDFKLEFSFGMFKSINLIPDLHNLFFDLVDSGCSSVNEIFLQLIAKGYSWEQCSVALLAFIGLDYLRLLIEPKNIDLINSFNKIVFNRLNHEVGLSYLIAPFVGDVVYFSLLELAVINWKYKETGEDLVDIVLRILSDKNALLLGEDGKPLQGIEEQKVFIQDKCNQFIDKKLPIWEKIGVLRFLTS